MIRPRSSGAKARYLDMPPASTGSPLHSQCPSDASALNLHCTRPVLRARCVTLGCMPELNGAPATVDDLKALALTNYGHYTSMRADDQHIRGLTHHLDRLVRDCRLVFDEGLDRDTVQDCICHAIRNEAGSYVIRVTIFDPALGIGQMSNSTRPHVLVTTRPAAALPAPPLRVQTIYYLRDLPQIKHIGLFGALSHRRTAQLNGFHDVLFVTGESLISEGATWNVGFFDGQNVIWPDADVLPGVTMTLLQQVHDRTIARPVSIDDIPGMQAAFATNTTVGVRPISAIDGVPLSPDHAIFDVLRKEYMEIPSEPLTCTRTHVSGE